MTAQTQYIAQLKNIDWKDYSSRNEKLRTMKKNYSHYVQNIQQEHGTLLHRYFLITITFIQYIFISCYIIITNCMPAFCMQTSEFQFMLQKHLITFFSCKNDLCNLLSSQKSLYNHGVYDISLINSIKASWKAITEFNHEYCCVASFVIKDALLELHKKNDPHLHQSLSFNKLDRSNLATQDLVRLCDALFEMHQALVSIKDSPDDNGEQQWNLFYKLFYKFFIISSKIISPYVLRSDHISSLPSSSYK